MLEQLFSADLYRLRRSNALRIGLMATCIACLYSVLVLAGQRGGHMLPAPGLFSMDASPSYPKSARPFTEALGSIALSGGLLPIVASIVCVLFFSEATDSGYDRALVSSGAWRRELVGARLLTCCLVSAMLLFASALVLAAALIVPAQTLVLPVDVSACIPWFVLATMHVALYAFVSTCVALLMRSRAAGFICALAASSGLVEIVLRSAARGVPWMAALVELLPDTLADALSSGPAPLFTAYAGGAPLWVCAVVVYALGTAAVYIAASAWLRRVDFTC